MENFKPSRPFADVKKCNIGDVQNIKFFSSPLIDSQIIELHSMLMTPTIHHVITKNHASGRALMDTFLPSLQYYNRIGCLTTQTQTHAYEVLPMLPILEKMIQNFGLAQAIELFFINYSDLEFVWIEFSKDLLSIISLAHIKQMCALLSRNESIPVVILQYENEEIC